MSKARELLNEMGEMPKMDGKIKVRYDGDVMVRGSDGKVYFGVIQNIIKVKGSKFKAPEFGKEREFLYKNNPLSFLDELPPFKQSVKFKPVMLMDKPVALDIEVTK